MREQLKIYGDRSKHFEKELKKLQNEVTSLRNKELITQFQNYLFSRGSGELRVVKLTSQLRAISRWLINCLNIAADFDKFTKIELEGLLSFITQLKEIKEATKADYRRVIKQFFLWFRDIDERVYSNNNIERRLIEQFYKTVESISTSYEKEEIDPLLVITDDDLDIVVDKGCRTHKEKSFVSTLHETGCRAGEFLNLRVGDIILKDNYAEIQIPCGKTGRRTIYIVKSIPFLLKYLDIHPYQDNKQSFLWLSDARFNLNEPLLHKGSQKLIDRCFKRAGIKKKHNLHWFRHSRASILAPKMTEVMLCKYMGWVIGSKQVRTYLHLCNKQLEDVFLSINQIKPKEEEVDKPIKCICGTLNNCNERYCYKCYKPLNVEVVLQDKELINSEINKTMQFFMDMAKNPELMKKFNEFKKNLGGK